MPSVLVRAVDRLRGLAMKTRGTDKTRKAAAGKRKRVPVRVKTRVAAKSKVATAAKATLVRTAPPPRAAKPRTRSSERPDHARPLIVGIGASAGGLEALETFFDAVPHDSGLVFVVVTHQHPDHPSLLPLLLARRASIPVLVASEGTVVEPNHAYVAAPGSNLTLCAGKLENSELVSRPGLNLPIDYFFRSLARDQGQHAACVVLSGTGTDGTLGLREIKAHSGLALVQDEQSAHYNGMPHSAAATLVADHVMRPEQMPAQLVAYARAAHADTVAAPALGFELTNALPRIFALLRNRVGHDFSGYRLNTIERRIERRMRVHQLTDPSDYVALLQKQPHELDHLFQDLLITVTHFFRDPSAFKALENKLAKLMELEPEPVSLRVWVAGCATGEEAYSIAIVALELAERSGKRLQLQIFATDLDPRAIAFARTGLYSEGVAADVGAERLQRFFVTETGGQRVNKLVRDCVVFATQNVLRDPPFTKLDLLSCRNMLIYLTSELQQHLLPLFHYALKPSGLLWLGTSETVTRHSDLFQVVDRKWKLYQRRAALPAAVPALDMHLLAKIRSGDLINVRGIMRPDRRSSTSGISLGHTLDTLLVQRYAPATLVVTVRGEIAYIHGRTGLFLEPSAGEPRHNLFAMAREGLRLPLQAAIRRATTVDGEIIQRDIAVHGDNGDQFVHIIVQRISDPEPVRGLFRVSFITSKLKVDTATSAKGAASRVLVSTRNSAARELKLTRESLQSTLTELQTSNEELMSANEEMQSVNEELQSTNEELETSKEEMQSMNEELQTVNSELQLKVDELAQVNDDMQNLLNGTDIATLFLDRELRIKRFSEQARRVVRLIAT
ncbi:MAG: hypothetical protein RL701_7291, partial [Pseudomonadota bacterium]